MYEGSSCGQILNGALKIQTPTKDIVGVLWNLYEF